MQEDTVKKITEMLLNGEAAPWRAEDLALEQGLHPPENIVAGTFARRAFVETKSGYAFDHIVTPVGVEVASEDERVGGLERRSRLERRRAGPLDSQSGQRRPGNRIPARLEQRQRSRQ